MTERYRDRLKTLADLYAHGVYKLSRCFPKEEAFGVTSQIRRAALSVVLDIVEGRTRKGAGEYKKYMEIAYGSLKESEYLLHFSVQEGFLSRQEVGPVAKVADGIGAMTWGIMRKGISTK